MAVANSNGAVIGAVPPPRMSQADLAAHAAASHVRRPLPVPPPFLSPRGSAALDRLLAAIGGAR
ncbi:hypothetical protein PV703_11480 [Streptomyces sp. ME01-24h]|nr:hypothetical protein [Streptomyces sp. ME01-24h]